MLRADAHATRGGRAREYLITTMLLQTNSYVVPKDKRAEHARLLNRFRQTMTRLGCESFEVFEQAGANWGSGEPSGRYVQLIRFRDKKQHQAVQQLERTDPVAQKLIAEFCELINFPYQQQQGLFAVGFYNSVLPTPPTRRAEVTAPSTTDATDATGGSVAAAVAPVVVASQTPARESDVRPATPLRGRDVDVDDVDPDDEDPDEALADELQSEPAPTGEAEPATDAFDLDLTELDLPDPSLDDDGNGENDHVDLNPAAGRNGSHAEDETGGAKR